MPLVAAGGHAVQPIVLGPSLPDTFYRGAGRIAHAAGACALAGDFLAIRCLAAKYD